jgi:hypothetical protein
MDPDPGGPKTCGYGFGTGSETLLCSLPYFMLTCVFLWCSGRKNLQKTSDEGPEKRAAGAAATSGENQAAASDFIQIFQGTGSYICYC